MMTDSPQAGENQAAMGMSGEDTPSEVAISIASDEDNDSSYSASNLSQTTSLASSIWNYHYENGRRYNSFRQGTYW